MVATGVASVLGAWESLFSNRKQWHINEIVVAELNVLWSDIEYREKDVNRVVTQEETDQFFTKFKWLRAEGERLYRLARGGEQPSVQQHSIARSSSEKSTAKESLEQGAI